MRVVLVHPAGSNWIPGKKDVTATANRLVPIGLLSIASYLEHNGVEVLVHDCLGPRAPAGVDANVRKLLSLEPDFLAFSTTTSAFLDAYDMAQEVRKARPAVKNVFGGVHVSGCRGAADGTVSRDRLSRLGRGRRHTSRIGHRREPCDA